MKNAMRNVILPIFLLILLPIIGNASDITGVITQASNNECNNGSINLILTGGKAPYTFTWTGPNGFNSQNEDIFNLVPGVYRVTVYDANCCIAELEFNLECTVCNSEIKLNSIQHALCNSTSGAIDITITDGPQSGILFKWYKFNTQSQTWVQVNQYNAGANGGDLSGLSSGKYKVVVIFGPCNLTKEFEVKNSGQISSSISVIKQVSTCSPNPFVFAGYYENSKDGAICVSVFGTNQSHTIKWYRNGVFLGTGSCKYDLEPGSYTFQADFGNGCVVDLGEKTLCCCGNPTTNSSHPDIPFCASTSTGNPSTEPMFIDDIQVTSATSAQSNDGSISFSVSPEAQSYTYHWSPSQQGSNSISNLSPGTYCVTVTNTCAEQSATRCFTIRDCSTAEMNIYGSVTNTCPGFAYGAIVSGVFGSGGPFKYRWNIGATTQAISNLAPGTYCVTATAQDGCTRSRCFTVTDQQSFDIAGYYTCGTSYSCNGRPAYNADYFGPLDCGYENCNYYTCRCPLTNGVVYSVDDGFIGTFVYDWGNCAMVFDCRDGSSFPFAGGTFIVYSRINGICYANLFCRMPDNNVAYISSSQTGDWNCAVAPEFSSNHFSVDNINLVELYLFGIEAGQISKDENLLVPSNLGTNVTIGQMKELHQSVEKYQVTILKSGLLSNSLDCFSVSPNPFHDRFTVKNLSLPMTDYIVKVSDWSGRQLVKNVWRPVDNGESILIGSDNQSDGVYFLEILSDSKVIFTQKLIKISK